MNLSPRGEAGEPSAPYRRPPPLKEGDQVALISPSSHQGEGAGHLIGAAEAILASWGLEVANAGTPERRHLYLAGSDAERAREFQQLYCDPSIRALFFTRGGYGAARILPLLEREAIARAAPKAVVGFSDATALFAYLHAVAGISVVHGPCLAAPAFHATPPRPAELEALRAALFVPEREAAYPVATLHAPPALGPVTGRLMGGCLAVLVTTLGTPWEVDTRGAILFLEDTNEAPYELDRMITHLHTAGKLDGLRGLVWGHLQNCAGGQPGLLQGVLRDLFGAAPFPVATGLPAGHGIPNLPLALGQLARLELAGAGGSLTLL